MLTSDLIANGYIPEEFAKNIKSVCDCGFPIERTPNLRSAWCTNARCPYHEKYKAVEMFKYLGVQNIGPATAEIMLKSNGVTDHIDLIPLTFAIKPSVYLWEVVKLVGIRGYDDKLQDMLNGYKSMDEIIKDPNIPMDIRSKWYTLKRAEEYFDIKRPLSSTIIYIMITGSIPGYKDREDFVKEMNSKLGAYIQVRLVGKRMSNVDYLVTSSTSSTSSKAQLARRSGIPIIKPEELLQVIRDRLIK